MKKKTNYINVRAREQTNATFMHKQKCNHARCFNSIILETTCFT